MANVTVYLPDDVEQKLRKVADGEGKSVSRWIAGRLTELLDDSPATELLKLSGAFPDFPDFEELRSGYGPDSPRETVD